jgi:hypothetical protein
VDTDEAQTTSKLTIGVGFSETVDAKYSPLMDAVQVTMDLGDERALTWISAGEAAVLAEKLQIAIEQVKGGLLSDGN